MTEYEKNKIKEIVNGMDKEEITVVIDTICDKYKIEVKEYGSLR